VHLRDTDLLGDLSLRHLPEETQYENGAFALRQLLQQRTERVAVFDEIKVGVDLADPLRRGGVAVAVQGIKCAHLITGLGLESVQNLIQVNTEVLGQFRRLWGAG
jgi:hypothetical protein